MSDITQKTQKLSSAVYFLTSFFDDKEPLKWKLRTLAIDLSAEVIRDKYVIAQEILTLFGIAKTVGLVSDPNYLIISAELSKFSKERENPLEQVFFQEEVVTERILSAQTKTNPVKDKIFSIEDKPMKREMLPEIVPKPLKEYGVVSVKKNSRQSTIIGLLKRKKEIMIKDVLPLIEGCSEKTIQRELLAMVASGILKKMGEKRWSRYSLV